MLTTIAVAVRDQDELPSCIPADSDSVHFVPVARTQARVGVIGEVELLDLSPPDNRQGTAPVERGDQEPGLARVASTK